MAAQSAVSRSRSRFVHRRSKGTLVAGLPMTGKEGNELEKHAPPTIPPDSNQATPLMQALNTNEDVQTTVAECADELGAVNVKKKEEFTDRVRLSEVQQVLSQSQDIESKVEACADDLQAVNTALGQEITERGQLERALSNTQAELSETKIELSVTQVAEEQTPEHHYNDRTMSNVRDADATLIVTLAGELTGGTLLTRQSAQSIGRPWLHLMPTDD